MQQLPLAISPPIEPQFANFIAGPNAEALARVRELAAGATRERIVYLWGAPGCGRTHLLLAAARANPALVIADDVDTLDAAHQQGLFVAINEAREGGPGVLAAGAKPPAQLHLRDDLRTRLAWGLVYELLPVADEDKARHLKSLAAARGLTWRVYSPCWKSLIGTHLFVSGRSPCPSLKRPSPTIFRVDSNRVAE